MINKHGSYKAKKPTQGQSPCFIQLLVEGPKYMQMGGFILKMESIADGIVQIPSPHIRPEATAPA